MKIIIPTFGRPFRQSTAEALDAAGLKYDWVLSTGDPKAIEYNVARKELHHGVQDIRVASATTISEKRQWIVAHYYQCDKLVMLDDDLTFYARRRDGRFTKSSPADVRRMFKWLENSLDKYAHAGVIDKFMSNAAPRGAVKSRRYNAVLAYNFALWPRPRPTFRVSVSEEHDVHLQLADYGLAPLVSCEFSKNTSYYSEGGCSKERTARSELAGHKAFARNWPDLVSVVDSKTSLSGKAVKVKWRKSVRTIPRE